MAPSAALLLALSLATGAGPASTPTWRGRDLGHWLRTLSEPTSPDEERWLASEALAHLLIGADTQAPSREEALPALERLVRDVEGNPAAAARAAELLALLGSAAAPAREALAGVLIRTASNPDYEQAQIAAAIALRAIGSAPRPAVYAVARAAAISPSAPVRAACLAAMRRLGEPQESVPLLADALSDPSEEVRWAAARGLAELGPAARDALPALRAALEDRPGSQSRFLAWVQQAFPGYSDDSRSTAAAAAALLALGDEAEGLAALRLHLGNDDWLVRQAALEAAYSARAAGGAQVLPLLQLGLDDAQAPVRRKAAVLIGRLGQDGAPARPSLLRRAADDPDPFVRLASLSAAADLIQEEGGDVTPLLERALSDPSLGLRLEAVRRLARHDPRTREVVLALDRATRDPDPEVRSAAEAALSAEGDSDN